MELIEQVREIGADETRLLDSDVLGARAALTREITRSPRGSGGRRPQRARKWAGIGLGGLVAGAAVTAIVIGSVIAPSATPSAAADVFEQAADGAADSASAPVPAGHYLRFETTFDWNALWDADLPEGIRFNNADPDDAEATLLVRDRNTLYVPSDASAEWIRERAPYAVIDAHGARQAEARAEWEADSPGGGLAGITRYPGGIAEAGCDGGTFEYHLDDREVYADMPEDVPGIIRWFSERYEGEGDRNGLGHYFVETISDVSVFNLAPPAARSGMLRAFATLDDVSVISSDGNIATLGYERRNSDGETSTIRFSLDLARGYVLQVISWPFGADPDHDAWASRTDASIGVVDAAP